MLRLAVIQSNPQFGNIEFNLERLKTQVENVDADIFVFTELCSTGYFFQSRKEALSMSEENSGPTLQFFRELAEQKQAVVHGGFVRRVGEKVFNASALFTPESLHTPTFYHKTHLFYKEKQCFDPGDSGFVVHCDNRRDCTFGLMICYDWRFPEAARTLMVKGADIALCPSNLVTDAWHKVMPARAIENKMYMAVANRWGNEMRNGEELQFKGLSAIHSYNGETMEAAKPEGDTVIYTEIHPEKTRDKSFNALNDVQYDRRPDMYSALTEPVKQ